VVAIAARAAHKLKVHDFGNQQNIFQTGDYFHNKTEDRVGSVTMYKHLTG